MKISFVAAIIAIIVLTSCSEYQKVLKSSDYELKYAKAVEYFDKKDYYRSLSLLEELMTVYRGTDKAEDIYFRYCYSYYYEEDYILAAYYFESFTKTFPNSQYVEEFQFMGAYCHYLNSSHWELDQSSTVKGIEALQFFINKYPSSTRVEEANQLIDKLRAKLERKAYDISKLYFKLSEYQAAVITIKNTLNQYPDMKYREELTFLILKSNYLFARNSIETKKKERMQNVVTDYYALLDEYPQSKYLKEAEKYYTEAVETIKK